MNLSELFEDSPGKRVLMSGNEAFARGIFESGVKFAANYPGTPLSEVGDYLNYLSETSEPFIFDYSLNEKVALESCIGASWAGARSVAMFKHLGLNVAADPLHTFPYSGIKGGMLILCGSDPGILSSTNAQDNRLYSLHTKIPILEPGTVQECKEYIKEGLRLSELYQIPVYINATTRLCHSYGVVVYNEIQKPTSEAFFEKNPTRYVNTLWKALENQRNYFNKIADLAKNRKLYYLFNKVKTIVSEEEAKSSRTKRIGILTSGVCYSYVVQACHKLGIEPPILKLGLVFPINHDEICHFANEYNLDKLLIVEELEPFLEALTKRVFCNYCDAQRDLEIHGKDFLPNTGELNTDLIMKFFSRHYDVKNKNLIEEIDFKENALLDILPSLPIREPTFCPGCQYRPVFYILKKVTKEFLKTEGIEFIFAGDIGCYTLSESYPYQLLDWVICMGAGIGIADGMAQVINPKKQKLIAYVGDSTFFHTGIQPLINAIKNNIDLTILIFNNYWTAMTGHQIHVSTPRKLIEKTGVKSKTDVQGIDLIKLVESLGAQSLTITDAYNLEKLERIFNSTLLKSGTKIIIINEECALEKKRRLKKERKASPSKSEVYYNLSDSCIKCNECIEKLGCPAINARIEIPEGEHIIEALSKKNLTYYIDEARCMPYVCPGVCKNVCKNNFIHKTIINRGIDDKKG